MFEVGADTGDQPGEFQYWVERDHLDRIYPLPAAYHAARMNADGEMAVLTGQGTAHAAATIMALGLDPRFDLTHAYWIVAGIAGAIPAKPRLALRSGRDGLSMATSATRSMPARSRPIGPPATSLCASQSPLSRPPLHSTARSMRSTSLAEWAFNLTRSTPLADSDHLKEIRANFDGAAAQRPPFVTMGDEISSSTYWHGTLFDAWAAEWVPYFTGGKGEFATTAMEDTGTLQSLRVPGQCAWRVDCQRVLVLRTVSNYDRQPRGMTAAESLARQRIGKYSGYLPSLEAAYTVGHVVVSELLSHWTKYQQTIPNAGCNPHQGSLRIRPSRLAAHEWPSSPWRKQVRQCRMLEFRKWFY